MMLNLSRALVRCGRLACALALAMSSLQTAQAVVFPEIEPNDSKAAATPVVGMSAATGDAITGLSTGTSTTAPGIGSADYFNISMAPAPLGIYRHRLILNSNTPGHTGTIRGLSQTAAPVDTAAGVPWDGVVGTPGTADNAVQTTSTTTTPARFNQWYGFGKAERLFYRVTGTTSTTTDYQAILETVPVTPVDIGTYQPGDITISTFNQGHSVDTDFWVYDGNLDAIRGYGNDDESAAGISGGPGTGATLQGWLTRPYTPGTYYLALSNFNVQNDQPSPSDDDFRTGSILDFPNLAVNSSTTTNTNMQFTISDSSGFSSAVANQKAGAYDINWFRFTVVPEPAGLAWLLAAVAILAFRRK